ncbi:hypothetical protein QBC42DRAFT_263025 [Cladorrhinum samala]|uniref:Uncharacterized protein n=1 Tax=Cladorrhinum samala TaxID=585594 RepID=A0AAV9HWF9_9PEZI|nr:hypothetical protein QBC42DRAFT_263025 [Cladorrhinum samala]
MMSSLLTRLDTVTRRNDGNQQAAQAPPPTPSTVNSMATDTMLSRQTSIQSRDRSSHSLTTTTTATSWGQTGVSPRSSHQQSQRQSYLSPHLRSASSSPLSPEQRAVLEESFTAKHGDLTARAAMLLAEIQALKCLGSVSQIANFSSSSPTDDLEEDGEDHHQTVSEEEALRLDEDMLAFLRGIGHGNLASAPSSYYPASGQDDYTELPVVLKPQAPIRALARSITAALSIYDRDAAYDLAIQDFQALLAGSSSSALYYSSLPAEVSARASLLSSALPSSPDPDIFVSEAIMHFEHEVMLPQNPRYYVNSTTFKYKVSLADIPRERFLSTSDHHAWDMQELVNEIVRKDQGKEMRNPVTGDAFAPEDVKRIRGHPLGRGIVVAAAGQEEKEVQSDQSPPPTRDSDKRISLASFSFQSRGLEEEKEVFTPASFEPAPAPAAISSTTTTAAAAAAETTSLPFNLPSINNTRTAAQKPSTPSPSLFFPNPFKLASLSPASTSASSPATATHIQTPTGKPPPPPPYSFGTENEHSSGQPCSTSTSTTSTTTTSKWKFLVNSKHNHNPWESSLTGENLFNIPGSYPGAEPPFPGGGGDAAEGLAELGCDEVFPLQQQQQQQQKQKQKKEQKQKQKQEQKQKQREKRNSKRISHNNPFSDDAEQSFLVAKGKEKVDDHHDDGYNEEEEEGYGDGEREEGPQEEEESDFDWGKQPLAFGRVQRVVEVRVGDNGGPKK